MQRVVSSSGLLMVALLALASPAQGCPNNVADLDIAFQAATAKKDVAALERMLPDDYILVTSKGQINTKQDLLNDARDASTVYSRQDDSNRTVRIWGDTAVITALLTAIGTVNGKPFEYHVWFSDVYLCTASGWRYTFAQVGGRV